jgi:hypothetical protein
MRDRLELIWLRITLLPKAVSVLLVGVLVVGVIGGSAALFVNTGGSIPDIGPNTTKNTDTTGDVLAADTREASAAEIAALVKKVDAETDPGRAVRVATNEVRYDDSLDSSCEKVLKTVGASLYKKFGAEAVSGDSAYCAANLVVGATLAAFQADGATIATAKSVAAGCENALDRNGCIGGVVAGVSTRLGADQALEFCGSQTANRTECGSNAVRPLLSDRVKPMPISVCTKLADGEVKNGCTLAFGTRYAGLEQTIPECEAKLKGDALTNCEYGFALLLGAPPAGITTNPALFNQCAVAKNCPSQYARVLRDSGRTVEQVEQQCMNFEAVSAREACLRAAASVKK